MTKTTKSKGTAQSADSNPLGCKECKKLKAQIVKMTGHKNAPHSKQRFFDEKWLASRWGCSVNFVRKLRYAGGGPKITFFGTAVRYRLRHILEFERARSATSTSDLSTKDFAIA